MAGFLGDLVSGAAGVGRVVTTIWAVVGVIVALLIIIITFVATHNGTARAVAVGVGLLIAGGGIGLATLARRSNVAAGAATLALL